MCHFEDPQLGSSIPRPWGPEAVWTGQRDLLNCTIPWSLEVSGQRSGHWEGGQRSGMPESRRSTEE